MKKEKIDKFIVLFLFLQPLLDALTAWQLHEFSSNFSVSTIIRGIFFIVVLFYLFKNKYQRKILIVFCIYVFLAMGYFYFYTNNSILYELFNFFKIFYLPFLIYFFNYYENKKIDDKFITKLYFIYLNLIIIPYLFNIGYRSYELDSDKSGYIGLFYGGNEISAILIGLLPIALNFILQNKNWLLKIFFGLEIGIVTIIIGTKAMFLGIIIVIAYFFLKYLLKIYKQNKSKFKKIIWIPIPIIICVGLVLPKTPVYKNLQVALNYYGVQEFSDLLSIKSIDNIIFSTRLSYLENIHNHYKEQGILTKLFGLGDDARYRVKDVEIDIFDIFYKIGAIGFIVWIVFMIIGIKKRKLNGIYSLSFWLLITVSMFSGHILLKPMVSIYLALMFILNKNKEEVIENERKK